MKRGGFDIWTESFIADGERCIVPSHGCLALQCASADALIVACSIHLSCLADGRVSAFAENDESVVRVASSVPFAERQACIVMRASTVSVVKVSNCTVKSIDGAKVSFAIGDQANTWELSLKCIM